MGKLSGAEKKSCPRWLLRPLFQFGTRGRRFQSVSKETLGSGKNAGMAELVDARDLGSRAFVCESSSLSTCKYCIIFRGV